MKRNRDDIAGILFTAIAGPAIGGGLAILAFYLAQVFRL